MGRKVKTRKVKTMDAVLVTMAVFLLVFVAAMLWLYRTTGGIPDTLCTCVFAACGGECGVMGWIKTTKERQRERGYELYDRLWEGAKPTGPSDAGGGYGYEGRLSGEAQPAGPPDAGGGYGLCDRLREKAAGRTCAAAGDAAQDEEGGR